MSTLAGSQDVPIALVSDFGTGEYCSRYIARHIESLDPDCVVHHLKAPLAPLAASGPVFALNANHTMKAEGRPYFVSFRDWFRGTATRGV